MSAIRRDCWLIVRRLVRTLEKAFKLLGVPLHFNCAAPACEFFLDVIAVIAPGRAGSRKLTPRLRSHTGVVDGRSVFQFNTQNALACVVSDGAQFAGIDLLHFHDSIHPCIEVLCLPDTGIWPKAEVLYAMSWRSFINIYTAVS